MAIHLVGWAVVGAIGAAFALMGRHSDKKADANYEEAKRLTTNALASAKLEIPSLNALYRPFFEQALANYTQLYTALKSAMEKEGAKAPEEIKDPGDFQFEDKLDINEIAAIDFSSIDWNLANRQAAGALANYRSHMGAAGGAQAFQGMATTAGGVFLMSAVMNYAENADRRLTLSIREIARAKVYVENLAKYLPILAKGVEEDIAIRRHSLEELRGGAVSAGLTRATWPVAMGILHEIVDLIERPIAAPTSPESSQ